jgi:O-acetylserine/cysteine efflux transporter
VGRELRRRLDRDGVGAAAAVRGDALHVGGDPAVFFVRPPGNGWKTVVACGFAMGAGQFGLLYTALSWGMPAGLASLVLQVQTVFTVVIASLWLRERPTPYQLAGIAVGVVGMAVVGAKHLAAAPILPFLMTVAAAASWATGNVLTPAPAAA